MKKILLFGLLLILFGCHTLILADVGQLHNLGYVVVSPNGPDDGGDYGPNTPGTQTSGIQEAFNYAKSNTREVYIVGGSGNSDSQVVYDLSTTLTIPWGQDWHCDGGNYVMNFTQTTGDCLVIDSQMNSQFTFGTVSAPNLTSGSIVKVVPTVVGPDNFIVCVSSIFQIAAIVGPTQPGQVGQAYGLTIDGSLGAVVYSKISVREIKGCDTGLLLNAGGIVNTSIEAQYIHTCNTALRVNTGSYNVIKANVDPDGIAGTYIGADIDGGDGTEFDLSWQGTSLPGNALILGSGTRDNLIYARNLPQDGITNNASTKSSRVVSLKPVGFNITTPSVPGSGANCVNNSPYPVTVMITDAGAVSSWTIRDSYGTPDTVTGNLFSGQSIYLAPGESISFAYSQPPTWRWRAMP